MPAAFAAAHPVAASLLSNAGNIGSMLGGTAAIGSLFGSSSGGTSIYKSAQLMKLQDKMQRNYTQWLNENQYSQLRTGLEKAGYNPLLALGASPQQGSIGIGNAVNSESKTAQIMNALAGMAQIENLKANTAQAQTGILGKLLGSEGVKHLKELFGASDGVGIAKNLLKQLLSSITSNVASPASESGRGTMLLKGYVTNDSDDYDYKDKGHKLKVIDNPENYTGRSRSYNMAPRSFPYGM